MQHGRRSWLQLALLAAATATLGAAHSHIDTSSRLDGGELFVPHPAHVQLLSLGFDAVVADYYWLRAVQLVGGTARVTQQHGEVIASLLEVVTAVDPWVDHPYRFAAVWLTESPELVIRANAILERGIRYHPTDWRNRYHLGFNRFFYLEESLAAAEILETAVGLERAPHYLARLVARLRAQQAGLGIAKGFLLQMVKTADDEFARAEYLKALDEIEVEHRARQLDAARETFWSRNGRDIFAVSDLVSGRDPVLAALPPAHPELTGFEWLLDPTTGQITSSFYKSRYQLHMGESDKIRQKRWRELRETAAAES